MSVATLELEDGGWLELKPLSYELELPLENEHDANWLVVEFSADLGPDLLVGRRKVAGLLTWELHDFVAEVRQFLDGERRASELKPIEPHLVITLTASDERRAQVAIGLALSFAPPGRERFDEPFWKRGTMSREKLLTFAEELVRELSEFPVRRT
jgi:hypothetical protein